MAISVLSRVIASQTSLAHKLFDELATHTFDGEGITRASYGEGEQAARDILEREASALGLNIDDDAAGNLYMTLPGRDRSAKPIIIGSHMDSVAQGGNFDGAAGIISGLVACAGFKTADIIPMRDIKVMGIRAEESAWFGVSYIGSRAALGILPAGTLENARRIDTNRSLAEHMAEAGYDPKRLIDGEIFLAPKSLHAYIEIHIEQGPILEKNNIPVGIVTGIRGNRRFPRARCIGEYSHCGGVPREYRRDAVIAVSEFVQGLDNIWDECEKEGLDFAFTVGKIYTDVKRHAMTKIAGTVDFSLDIRSLDSSVMDRVIQNIDYLTKDISENRGVTFELGECTSAAPGPMAPEITMELQKGTHELKINAMQIASGASHDAAAFAATGVPTQMIFIRNKNGSHNPNESMKIDDFMEATKLLGWWLENSK